jgi:hypothetical protein
LSFAENNACKNNKNTQKKTIVQIRTYSESRANPIFEASLLSKALKYNLSEKMNSNKTQNHASKGSLSTIKCECGHEILLLPDARIMGQTIENHALEHKKKYALTQEETSAIIEALIAQAFELAFGLQENECNSRYGAKVNLKKDIQ